MSTKEYEAELRRMVQSEFPPHAVIFTGFRSDVLNILQMADVVVHASTSPEPFGRVIIEAMAMERPIISTTIGAPSEIIEHGRTGCLVPPGKPDALSEAIEMLLKDKHMRIEMGRAAKKEVITKYSIDAHTKAVEEIYNSLGS